MDAHKLSLNSQALRSLGLAVLVADGLCCVLQQIMVLEDFCMESTSAIFTL